MSGLTRRKQNSVGALAFVSWVAGSIVTAPHDSPPEGSRFMSGARVDP